LTAQNGYGGGSCLICCANETTPKIEIKLILKEQFTGGGTY
jgi:hypothetical protein